MLQHNKKFLWKHKKKLSVCTNFCLARIKYFFNQNFKFVFDLIYIYATRLSFVITNFSIYRVNYQTTKKFKSQLLMKTFRRILTTLIYISSNIATQTWISQEEIISIVSLVESFRSFLLVFPSFQSRTLLTSDWLWIIRQLLKYQKVYMRVFFILS